MVAIDAFREQLQKHIGKCVHLVAISSQCSKVRAELFTQTCSPEKLSLSWGLRGTNMPAGSPRPSEMRKACYVS